MIHDTNEKIIAEATEWIRTQPGAYSKKQYDVDGGVAVLNISDEPDRRAATNTVGYEWTSNDGETEVFGSVHLYVDGGLNVVSWMVKPENTVLAQFTQLDDGRRVPIITSAARAAQLYDSEDDTIRLSSNSYLLPTENRDGFYLYTSQCIRDANGYNHDWSE